MKKYYDRLVRKQEVDTAEQEADQADQNDNSKGNTILSNQNNLIYYGQVTIGTPGQNFSVLFDTANADLWVPGLNCTTAACLATTLYDPSISSTAVGLGTSFTDSNTYGSVTGWVFNDRVAFGTDVVSSQNFGSANNANDPVSQRSL